MSGGIRSNTHHNNTTNRATLPALSTTKSTSAPTPVLASNITESPTSSPEADEMTNKVGHEELEDPLVAFEHRLMARPLRSFTLPILHGVDHQLPRVFHSHFAETHAQEDPAVSGGAHDANQTSHHRDHLAPQDAEMPIEDGHSFHFHPHHHSHVSSRSPTPGARRCMEATAAWTPRLDRRQSWDGQAYHRAVMEQTSGMLHGVCPRHQHNKHGDEYEADRGFTETVRHAKVDAAAE